MTKPGFWLNAGVLLIGMGFAYTPPAEPNPWLAWGGIILGGIILGAVGAHFGNRRMDITLTRYDKTGDKDFQWLRYRDCKFQPVPIFTQLIKLCSIVSVGRRRARSSWWLNSIKPSMRHLLVTGNHYKLYYGVYGESVDQ